MTVQNPTTPRFVSFKIDLYYSDRCVNLDEPYLVLGFNPDPKAGNRTNVSFLGCDGKVIHINTVYDLERFLAAYTTPWKWNK
jgi:hypothetical protein